MADGQSSFLRRRVAGIPVLYIFGAVAVVLAVLAWRMRDAPEPDVPSSGSDVPMETQQNDPDAELKAYEGFVAKSSITAAPAEKPDDVIPEETNATWLKKAVEWRVSQGASGGAVQAALQAYLSGATLSIEQGAERDKAIKQFGLPPEPPEKTGTVNSPTPIAPAKSQGVLPRYHRVVNTNDDTFVEVARIYYPTYDKSSVDLIRRYNYGRLVGTGPFKPGTTIYVPKYNVPKYYTSTKKTDTAKEIAKKNGLPVNALYALNPGMKFPLKSGTRVRVG